MHISQRFEHLLEVYRRPDGSKWSGQQIDEATGGIVSRAYVTNLRKGRIESPGYEKMGAIAKAMGFPPEMWFADDFARDESIMLAKGSSIAARLGHLFEVSRNPATGEQYTSAEVARMTLGSLSKEDVEGIRTGAISDPAVSQVVALAGIFGVAPSYLLDPGEMPLDGELVEALRNDVVRQIARDSSRLSDREKLMVLGIVRQFDKASDA